MFDFFVANICSFTGVRVTLSLVLYVCFVDRCLSFCTLSFWSLFCLFFDIQILITPLIYIYLQTLLNINLISVLKYLYKTTCVLMIGIMAIICLCTVHLPSLFSC